MTCSKTLTYVVQWHYRSAHPISAVVSHPRDELLAVFSSQPPSSTVSIFESSSSSPRNTYTVPFTLRNVVWYPQLPSKAKETSAFRLVGITDNWDVMFCGDDVHPLEGEGLVARGLLAGSQEPPKRTLLQDIWGDSALAGAPVDPLIQKVTSPAPRNNGKEIADILGGPAYLIPPLRTLFEPLMTHFLTPRPPEDETTRVLGLPGGDEEDAKMDVDKVDESQDSLHVSSVRTERVVDAREIDALVDLFQLHGVKGKRHQPNCEQTDVLIGGLSAPSPIPHAKLSNGHVPEVHNNVHKKVNGHSHTPKPKVNSKLNSISVIPNDHSSPVNLSHPSPKSSPATAGKKRKTMAAS